MLLIFQESIVTFIELAALLILWSKFELNEKGSTKKNLFIALVGSILLAVTDKINPSYGTLFSYLSIIICVKLIYNESLIKTTVGIFIFSLFISIFELAIIGVFNLIGFRNTDDFKFNLTIVVILLVAIILIWYYVPHNSDYYFLKLDSSILYYFVVNLGSCVIILKIIWQYDSNIILKNIHLWFLSFIIIFSINLLLYFYISKITEEKKSLEIEKRYKPILIEMIEETRRKQHDFKNYLNTINGIIEVSEKNELESALKGYIKGLSYSIKNLEDIVYIDNVIVKATVYNKLSEIERANIKFLYNITNNVLEPILSDYEISDILNNLLNNAFEAIKEKDDVEKVVILNILSKKDNSIIEVMNSGITLRPKEIETIFERGFSTKEGKDHGYGLYNVKKIVEHSGGKIQLSFENNYTIFSIKLL